MSSETPLDDFFGEENVEEVISQVTEEFDLSESITDEHFLFLSSDLRFALKVAASMSVAGKNVYDKAVLIEKQSEAQIQIRSASYGVYFGSLMESPSPSTELLSSKPVVVETEILTKLLKYMGNVTYFLVSEFGISVNVCGGQIKLPTHMNLDRSPFDKPDYGALLREDMLSVSIEQLKLALSIFPVLKPLKSINHKLLHFGSDGVFANANGTIIHFSFPFEEEFILQPKASEALSAFLSLDVTDLSYKTMNKGTLFSTGDKYLFFEPVIDSISSVVKDLALKSKPTFSVVPLFTLKSIIDVLSFSSKSSVVSLGFSKGGVRIRTTAKDKTIESEFDVGEVTDIRKEMSIPLVTLQTFITLFKGTTNLQMGFFNDKVVLRSEVFSVFLGGRE